MMKDFLSSEPKNYSHDNRIGIKLIKKKHDTIGKIEIVTRSIGTASESNRKQTISLEKYLYPIYEKNLSASARVSEDNLIVPQLESRSIKRTA